MERVDHIGIAVRDLDERITYYTETLGLKLLKVEEVESQQVRVAFIDAGNVKIELLEPMSEKSAIHGFIEKRGEGIHHVAFGVTGIRERMAELRESNEESEKNYKSQDQVQVAQRLLSCILNHLSVCYMNYAIKVEKGKSD